MVINRAELSQEASQKKKKEDYPWENLQHQIQHIACSLTINVWDVVSTPLLTPFIQAHGGWDESDFEVGFYVDTRLVSFTAWQYWQWVNSSCVHVNVNCRWLVKNQTCKKNIEFQFSLPYLDLALETHSNEYKQAWYWPCGSWDSL